MGGTTKFLEPSEHGSQLQYFQQRPLVLRMVHREEQLPWKVRDWASPGTMLLKLLAWQEHTEPQTGRITEMIMSGAENNETGKKYKSMG